MSKWKERIDRILNTEHERVSEMYREAQGSYHDTGYQRYYNQMERYQNELEEIETYQHSGLAIARAENEARRYRNAITTFRNQAEDYKLYHRGVERPIDETVDALIMKLEIALGERRLRE